MFRQSIIIIANTENTLLSFAVAIPRFSRNAQQQQIDRPNQGSYPTNAPTSHE
jgi:hypothetical protein